MNWLDILLGVVCGAIVGFVSIGIGRNRGRRDALDAMEATFNEMLPMGDHYSERLRLVLLRLRWQTRLAGLRVPPLEHEDALTERDDPFRKREES